MESLRSQLFIERFELPVDEPAATETSETESIVIRLDRRKHTLRYEPGDTILDAARRAALKPPFACERETARPAWPTSTQARSRCA